MQLNDIAVRSAAPGIHWDDSLKGFGLRVGKNRRTFLVRVGRGRNHRIGVYGLMTLADARKAAKEILAERTLGKVIPKHTAFEDARKDFLEDCTSRLKPSTVEQYAWHLNLFPWIRQSIAELTRKDIESVLKKQKPSVKEHLDRIGRTFFSWCARKELIDRSPMEKMDKPTQGKSRTRVLSPEELGRVYKAVKGLQTPLKRLLWLILHFGLRAGEARRLQWLYFSETTLTIPGEITKNGHPHLLPLTDTLNLAVMDFPHIDGSPYLFPASRNHVRGKPVTVMTISPKGWEAFQEECKVTNFTRHDLRRTLATFWAEKLAIEPHLIERALNHVSGEISGVSATYNRAQYLQQLRPCIERWENYLSTLAA